MDDAQDMTNSTINKCYLWLHTYFLPNKNNRHCYRLSFGGGWTTHPDLVVTTAPLTLLAGLATLG